MSTLTVAGLGAGYFSQFHYEAWRRHPRTHLLAAADLDIEKARLSQAEHCFTSLDELLGAQSPDLLDIITPPPTHATAIEQAINAGVKTIICQKPFCTDIHEARRMVELADENNVQLIVHENFRFQPWYRAMKSALDEGQLGDLHQFSFRLRTGDGQGEDAYLERQPFFRDMPRFLVHETGVHWLDTCRYLLGDPQTIYADLRKLNPAIEGEDAGFILLGYPDGVRALFDGNRLLDHRSENTRLTFGEALLEGSEASLSLTGDGQLCLRKHGELSETSLLKAQTWPGFAGDCVYALQDHVVRAVLDGGALENTASEYLAVLGLVHNVYQSAQLEVRLNTDPCPLPDPQ